MFPLFVSSTAAISPASMNGVIVLAFLFFLCCGFVERRIFRMRQSSGFWYFWKYFAAVFPWQGFFNFAGGSNMLDGGMNEFLQFLENF